MSKELRVRFLVIAACLIVAGITLLSFLYYQGKPLNLSPAVSPSTLLVPVVEGSGTPSASPSAIASPSPTPSLSPEELAARAAVDQFEAAYKAKNKSKLLTSLMTDPFNQAEKDEQSRLLSGQDTKGVPGGPTLFESATVSQIPQSYTVTSVDGGTVVVKEHVIASDQGKTSQADRTRTFELVKQNGADIVDRYLRPGSTDKYGGFSVD